MRVQIQLYGIAVVVAEDAACPRRHAEVTTEPVLELYARHYRLVARNITRVYAERLLPAYALSLGRRGRRHQQRQYRKQCAYRAQIFDEQFHTFAYVLWGVLRPYILYNVYPA